MNVQVAAAQFTTTTNHFIRFYDLGYRRLIPIVPPGASVVPGCDIDVNLKKGKDDRGKVPGTRLLNGLWDGMKKWQEKIATLADLEEWYSWGASVALVADQIVAVDADAYDAEHAEIIRRDVLQRFGASPVRIGQAPKAIYVFRAVGSIPNSKIEFGEPKPNRSRLEIIGRRKQFVLWGPHQKSGRPYSWPRDPVPFDELLTITAEGIAEMMAAMDLALPNTGAISASGLKPPPPQRDLLGSPDLIIDAMKRIPNRGEEFESREDYLNIGYALRGGMGADRVDDAKELFLSWCSKWEDGEPDADIDESNWRRMTPPVRLGAEFLYDKAFKASEGAFNGRGLEMARKHHEEVIDAASPEASAPELSLLGTPYRFLTADDIEPREFLYGTHYQREYASVTIAPTKIGKSSLGLVEAVAMASGKPLLGVQPEGLFRVRIWNGEDPQNEMDRRLLAVRQHFGVTPEDLGDRLFVDSGRDQPIAIAHMAKDGAKIYAPVSSAVRKALLLQQIDVLFIDPFVKSHAVSENDNMAIDVVVKEWNLIAGQTRVALELVHHSRKLNGAENTTIEDARGGSALVSGVRAARVLARMSEKQAKKLGRTSDYKSLFRIADAANNMAAAIVGEDETWYELISVDIRNARFDESGKMTRKSDKVGVATLSKTHGQGLEEKAPTPERANQETQALAALASGAWKDGVKAGSAWAGLPIAAAFGLDIEDPDDKAQAKAILAALISQKKVKRVPKTDKNRNSRIFIEVVSRLEADLFG